MKIKLKKKVDPIVLFPLYLVVLTVFISGVFNVISSRNKSSHIISKDNNVYEESYKIKVDIGNNTTKEFDIDEYLIGVVAAEMPPSFENEALKAQAVAARTYIINKKNNPDGSHKNADVCNNPAHCKAYISDEDAQIKWGDEWNDIYREKIKSAVYETKGMIITYENEPISAVFHSTSTGRTENSEDVWQTSKPYLKSVPSEGEELSPRYKSNVTVELNEFISKIKELAPNANFSSDKTSWIKNYSYTQGGSVKTVEVGGAKLKGTDIRSKFNLRSADFRIDIGNQVIFSVTGNGHGVGMSQYGANYAASNGSNYKEILKKYYTGIELEKFY